jgi:type II secretory pathway pseudopilin PulG
MKTIKKRFKKEKAFTMIELLLIIGILAVLAGVVIVALNPGVQLAKARNSERIADISDIYKAVQEYYVDNNNWPSSGALTTTLTEICDTNDLPSGCIDLDILVTEGYLTEIPEDPQADQGTDYFIALNGVNAIELAARNSTEQSQEGVVIGTTTDAIAGLPEDVEGGEEDYSCGDATDSDCWSSDQDLVAWSTWFVAVSTCTDKVEYEGYDEEENPIGDPIDDWRLPTRTELESAYTASVTGFTDNPFWSITEVEGNPNDAWTFNMETGVAGEGGAKEYSSGWVRCIR